MIVRRYWLAAAGICLPLAVAQAAVPQQLDERKTVALEGNIRPEALPENDRGALPDAFPLEHLQLLLKRPQATEAALERFIDSQYDRHSANFHRWLNAAKFGAEWGPAEADIAAVAGWLAAHGFTVNGVSTGRTVIDFSGSVGAVREAFHTEIHRLEVAGVSHIANIANPRIPAALAGVVAGVVSLHDFRPHPMYKPRAAYTAVSGDTTFYNVTPADLAAIYNFNPAFSAGISGQGQTVVVIEDTDIYTPADFAAFRSKFGLTNYTGGSLNRTHPAGSLACGDPGVVGDGYEGEAELDMEWASAAAPSATIEVASCADTSTNFGGLIALENLVDSASPPAVVSISYGECEAYNGATGNAAFNSVYQQAVSEGVSVFVSAGDEGAVSCDADLSNATHGIGVSGFASTPYNVAVGGTDFLDTYLGTNARYWGTNRAYFLSAKSYIPEIPWNDSCASVLISQFNNYTLTYGSGGFCSSTIGEDYITTASGSGGPSGCATGAPSTAGVVSGTCKGYAQPAWQTGIAGNTNTTVRVLPDVSLFAANGVWNHYYIYCDSDTGDGGAPCSGPPITWSGAGGTSFASPILAGIQALVNQTVGGAQGNPNPVYYALAATEFGASGNTACYSNVTNGAASSCVFHDIVRGDIDVNCTGTHDCFRPSGNYGVLSTSDSAYAYAYGAHKGWDMATGIGSVNVYNLLAHW